MDRKQRPPRALVVGLLTAHAALLLVSARLHFVTLDESMHIPAGLWHWRTGGFELYRVNPPLPRMLATLPLLAAGPDTDFGTLSDGPGRRPEWDAGPRFAAANAERFLDLLFLARLAGIGWSVLGGWLVCRWASELYGARAGCLALALWCFAPNVLAHAALVTPDLPATVAGLAACYVFWHYLRDPSWSRAWFAGLLLGVALLTKGTWLLLYALWPVLSMLYLWGRIGSARTAVVRLTQGLCILALGLLVLNLGYGFAGTGRPLGDFSFVSRGGVTPPLPTGEWRQTGKHWGNRFQGTWAGDVPLPLPADYVLGLDLQRRDFESDWPAFLGGEWQDGGRWYFYLYALAVKVPLGTWGLVLASLVSLLLRRRAAPWRDGLLVWLPPLTVLVAASSQTGLNYLRYVLPMAPFCFVAAGRLGEYVRSSSWKAGLVVSALGLWAVASSLIVYPHSLSYFNELAGGPGNGHRHLVDSNLDWGQDLLFLKRWLGEHPEVKKLGLAYFNRADPRLIGIEFDLPPLAERRDKEEDETKSEDVGPRPGWFAVSVHFVMGGGFPAPDGKGRWRRIPPGGYSYFRHFRPVARAGYSIWIYRIRRDEANAVREQMGLDPLATD